MRTLAYFLLIAALAAGLARAGEDAPAAAAGPEAEKPASAPAEAKPPLVLVCLVEEGKGPLKGRLVKYEAGVWTVRADKGECEIEDAAVAGVEFLPEPEPALKPKPEPRPEPKPERWEEAREKVADSLRKFEERAEHYRGLPKDERQEAIGRQEREVAELAGQVHRAEPELRDAKKTVLRRKLWELLAAYKGEAPVRLGAGEHMKKRFAAFTGSLASDKDREAVREALGPIGFLLRPRPPRRGGRWGRGTRDGPGRGSERREGDAPR